MQYATITEHIIKEPLWMKRGPMATPTATGYGSKIPTQHLVKIEGNNRLKRVFCRIYGNRGTLYVIDHGQEVLINELDLQ